MLFKGLRNSCAACAKATVLNFCIYFCLSSSRKSEMLRIEVNTRRFPPSFTF
jgi:hypothetical protein